MKKTVCSLLMAGGLIGTEAHAAVTAPASLPNRVAAVRAEINKRVAEGRDLGGLEAVTKLPYAQLEQRNPLAHARGYNPVPNRAC